MCDCIYDVFDHFYPFFQIYWKPTDGESPYNLSIFGDSLLLFGSTGINKGFMDDVFDLRWKYKIIFPIVASLPLLANYPGTTVISVPLPLRGMLGTSVDIGLVYYVYASMLSIFCMNSINIYAGINGLEVGQSLIIGFSVICINILEIVNSESIVHIRNQFLSLYVVVPFITVSLLLLYYNKYPSIVFVGDTYCYFAGTVFASVGILGHFSKTLLLMFLPQIFNFVISIPQVGLSNHSSSA